MIFDNTIDSIGLMALVWLLILWIFGRALWRLLIMLGRDPQFVRLLGVVVLLLASGAHIYHSLEGWSYLDALYFTVITLTTVGYGDFSPHTTLGKLFSMLYIVLGLGVLGALIAMITEKSHAWTAELRRSRQARNEASAQKIRSVLPRKRGKSS
ncbi:MAG: potassium channel family protein [Caldilineaceae bacterium]